jgi:hypothetical protein
VLQRRVEVDVVARRNRQQWLALGYRQPAGRVVSVFAHLAPSCRARFDQGADVRDDVAEEDDLVAYSRGGRRLSASLPNRSPSEEAQASAF